jgi:pyrophosphatase PpaX
MARYDAIVFDLDGTLIDTIPLIVASHRHALRTVLRREETDEVLKAGIGKPLLEQMQVFDPDHARELFDAYRVWNHANTAALLGRFEGVDAMLLELAAASIDLGIATSKSRDAVDLALRIQPLPVAFGATVTVDDTERHKPYPEPVLLAIDLLGASPERAVYVGDAPYDLEAAHAAGCDAVAVTWGVASRETLLAAEPHAIADTPAELLAILLGAVG